MKKLKYISILIISIFLVTSIFNLVYSKAKKSKKSKTFPISVVDNKGSQSYKNLLIQWNWQLKDSKKYNLTMDLLNRGNNLISFKLKLYVAFSGEQREMWDEKMFYIPTEQKDKFVIEDLPNVDYDEVVLKILTYKEEK